VNNISSYILHGHVANFIQQFQIDKVAHQYNKPGPESSAPGACRQTPNRCTPAVCTFAFGELSLPPLSAFLILHSTLSDRGNVFRHMEQDHISKARNYRGDFKVFAGLLLALNCTTVKVLGAKLIFSQPFFEDSR